jgi:hypothetical protein
MLEYVVLLRTGKVLPIFSMGFNKILVIALVGSSVFFQISPSEFLFQMVAPSNIFWDHARHLHTNALHWEGLPRLLWESLSLFFYTEPPQYDGVEYREEDVHRCRVLMTIPQHPFRSQWQPIEVDVVGYRLVDTIETAALEAIHIFCDQHPMEVAGYPIGLFPTIDSSGISG